MTICDDESGEKASTSESKQKENENGGGKKSKVSKTLEEEGRQTKDAHSNQHSMLLHICWLIYFSFTIPSAVAQLPPLRGLYPDVV